MLLKKTNYLFHWLDFFESSVLNHLDISEMGHDFHEKLFVCLFISRLGEYLDTIRNFFDERFNVLDLGNSVIQQEAGIAADPFVDGVLELFDKWSGIDS